MNIRQSGVSTSAETETSGSDRLVPPIDDPKNLTGIDPCKLLTKSQLAALSADFADEFCSVILGVSDTQALVVHYGSVAADAPGADDPCGFAESIASTILNNLPEA